MARGYPPFGGGASGGHVSIRRAPLLVLAAVLALSPGGTVHAQSKATWLGHYREPAARLIAEALGERIRLAAARRADRHDRHTGSAASPQLDRAIRVGRRRR